MALFLSKHHLHDLMSLLVATTFIRIADRHFAAYFYFAIRAAFESSIMQSSIMRSPA